MSDYNGEAVAHVDFDEIAEGNRRLSLTRAERLGVLTADEVRAIAGRERVETAPRKPSLASVAKSIDRDIKDVLALASRLCLMDDEVERLLDNVQTLAFERFAKAVRRRCNPGS